MKSQKGKKLLYRGELKSKEEQVQLLEQLLTVKETGAEYFTVFGMEAGGGKSVETDRLIGDHIRNGGTRTFLLVKKFREDVNRSAEVINDRSGNCHAALGITSESWSDIKKDPSILKSYQVLVISHRRYLDLSLDKKLRVEFESQRHTLIIDEHVDAPIRSVSEASYGNAIEEFMKMKKPELITPASILTTPLLETINSNEGTRNQLQNLEINVNSELLQELTAGFDYSYKSYSPNAQSYIGALHGVSRGISIFANKKISTLDTRITRWKLANNIILDANAPMDKQYCYAPDVKEIIVLPRIKNYAQTTIHPIIFNTSKSKIKITDNYVPTVCSEIIKNRTEKDKTLIVADKATEKQFFEELSKCGVKIGVGDSYDGESVAITHFGDFLGKNHWREFNKIWIVASNNWPMESYLLSLSFYTQEAPVGTSWSMSGRKGTHYGFTDPMLEEVRKGIVVSDIYQACKRINRFDEPKKADIFIINGDTSITEEVAKQFLNAKLAQPRELMVAESDEPLTSPVKINSKERLPVLIGKKGPGIYAKKDLCEEANIKSSNFARHLNAASERLKDIYVIKNFNRTCIEVIDVA